ncbi:MAG: Tol-Pal system beta propeller repeat protein TolB [Deltaproteobacteria bacterium]|nr:Tol-Pal system beta propeller repeat protein TolB [Deltaproteobacteria bacterium]
MNLHLLCPSGMRPAWFSFLRVGVVCLILFLFPGPALCRIYIDVNAPSIPKFNIAIPDFKDLGSDTAHAQLATKLPGVVSNDLDLSGYFNPMDKGAFLEEEGAGLTSENINFRDWSVIGAELLLKGGYTCIGSRLEVEIRLFDVFWGRQILGRRALGDISRYRRLMHRLSNEIIMKLTGHEGISLTKLAFVGNSTGKREIYVCDYDGHNVRPVTADKSIALLPRWSPDGKYLVYNSYKQGGPMLYLKNMASGAVRRLSGKSGLNIGASWAPNGREIALTMSYKGNPDIFAINLQGKILEQLVQHWGIDVSPAFSPDGDKIAFVSNRSGSPQIYTLDLVSRREERLTYKGRYNTSPAWSSRNQIGFVSMSEGKFDICTMDSTGGRLRRLSNNAGNDEDPCWSPDGRYIVFSSDREGRYHLYIMNANGQNQKRVTFSKGDQTAPSWAPE